jgi:hypothetical protein
VKAEKERKGLPVPAAVERIVESFEPLYPWLRFDVDSFFYLSRMRPVHFGGVGYISEEAIESYARMRGIPIPSEALDELILNIRVLDDAYMQFQREAEEKKAKAKGKDKPPGREIGGGRNRP